MAQKLKLGILGPGHLGTALYRGLISAGRPYADVILCARQDDAESVKARFHSPVTGNAAEFTDECDVIFITLKAAQFYDNAKLIAERDLTGKTIVSMMAGVSLASLKKHLPNENADFVRAMPSLAIETRDGIIGYTAAPKFIAETLEELGYAFECTEDEIEKVTAFSGCGPGFAALIIDAFSKAGISLGFSEKQADLIASRTFKAVSERGGDYRTLASQVATPGGATEAGLNVLLNANIYETLESAIKASYSRYAPKES